MYSNLPPGMTDRETDIIEDDPSDIREVTDKAIGRGYKNANKEWKEMALACVRTVCENRHQFTMNDVRGLIDISPIKTHDKRAIGGIIKKAKKLKWIEPTGQSIMSKVGHKSPLQIWRSKLYQHPKLF